MNPKNEPLPFWLEVSRGATDESLLAAEAYVGHRLPRSLRELLKQQNGGISNFSTCGFAGRYPMLPMMGVAPEASVDTLMRAHDLRHSFGVPDGVVVFAAIGDAWLGLDYRYSSEEPTVLYGDSEREPVEISRDFDRFLESLQE